MPCLLPKEKLRSIKKTAKVLAHGFEFVGLGEVWVLWGVTVTRLGMQRLRFRFASVVAQKGAPSLDVSCPLFSTEIGSFTTFFGVASVAACVLPATSDS